jgi:phage terminase large subunit
MEINLQTTNVFDRTIASNTRYIVNRGGGASSKTVSVLQALIVKFLTEKNKRIVIIRKTLPALRDSTHTLFLELLDSMGVKSKIHEEKQFLNYFYKSNEIRFRSLDNPDKIKSGEFNYAFLEEATELSYKDFEMIDMYMRKPSTDGKRNQMYVNLNPVSMHHWIKTKLVDVEGDLTEIISTYKDNPFLSDDHRKKLEGLINKDPNLYRVYTLGEWGVDSDLVFTNWKLVDEIPLDKVNHVCSGADFGFNDPMTLVRVYQHKKETDNIYLEEVIYKSGLITSEFITLMNSILPDKERHTPIYGDNAEPDKIKEIRRAGYNIKPCKKGKNSIVDGINCMKKYKIHVPRYCANMVKEFQVYSWEKDKDGDPLDKPVDFMNHILDGVRYAIFTGLNKKKYNLKWL